MIVFEIDKFSLSNPEIIYHIYRLLRANDLILPYRVSNGAKVKIAKE